MDQVLSEAHRQFRHSVRRFVGKEVIPRRKEIGEAEKIPLELWRKVCDLGVIMVTDPDSGVGSTCDAILLGIAAEEIAKGDLCLAITLIPNVGLGILLQHAAREVRKEWLSPVVSGEKLGCFSVTEDQCGADMDSTQTIAHKHKDYYIISGKKAPVGWGMYGDVAVVLAKTAPRSVHKGLGCIVLPLDIEGVTRFPIPTLGLVPIGLAELGFEKVRIPRHYLIGQEGQGKQILLNVLDLMRVLSSLVSIGAAQAVLDETVSYVKQRVAFGKPIGKFEGVSFRIVEAATLLEAGRNLCYKALMVRNQQGNCHIESAMCKWWVTKVAVDVVHDALILHGYFGYTSEGNIERCLRGLMGLQMANGSRGAMKLLLVKKIMGKEFLPYC